MKVGVWSDVGQSNVSIVTAGAVKAYNADINLLAGDLRYLNPRSTT